MAVWAVSVVSFGPDILNELAIVVFLCDYVRFSVLQPTKCRVYLYSDRSIRRHPKTNQSQLKNAGDGWN